ncbi:RNA polymerase II transcription factor B subunit 4, partial [Nowakowskiella sp. JEL0078]
MSVISLLVVVLDANAQQWQRVRNQQENAFENSLDHVLIFLNAHLALRHDNLLAVIACNSKKSSYLFPKTRSPLNENEELNLRRGNMYQAFKDSNDSVISELKRLVLENSDPGNEPGSSMIASAWSLGLSCTLMKKKFEAESEQINARILTISLSSDSSIQYIPMMNCIFAAQKSEIKLDVCKIYADSCE